MSGMGIAVVGASARSTMILGHLKQRPEDGFVTGIYDLVPERSRVLLGHYGLSDAKAYGSLEEAVGDARAQAAFVSTTDCAHAACSIAALKADKHVFCEKPMALTLKDCDAMVAAARKAQGVLYVGMNLRHSPVHVALHELVREGRLGRLLTIETNEYYTGGRTYFRRWNRLRKYGGGLWLTKACHDFDLLNWFAGGRATRVHAVCALSHYKPKEGAGTHCRACGIAASCPDYYDFPAAKDSCSKRLRLATEQATGTPTDLCLYNSDKDTFDNGIALVEYDNDVRASYTLNVVSARDTRQMRLMGTEGSAEGDMETRTVTSWKRFSKEKVVQDLTLQMQSGHGGADSGVLADFFRCCRTGEPPRSSWAEGRACVAVGLAATESCDTGKPVVIRA